MSETHRCPHCQSELASWIGPPESGWGEILVCNNNDCPFFRGSNQDITHKDEDNSLGCRYAVNPDNGYKPFALLSWYKFD